MRGALLLAVFVAGCAVHGGPAPAGRSPDAVEPRAPALVRTSDTQATVSIRAIRAHMEFLASDALHGRGSGTRDEWITATYLASAMRYLDLEPLDGETGFVQEIEIQRFEVQAPPHLQVDGRTLTHGDAMLVRTVVAPRVSGPLRRFTADAPVEPGTAVIVDDPIPTEALGTLARAAIVLQRETAATRARWTERGGRVPPMASQVVGVPRGLPRGPTWVMLDEASHAAVAALGDGPIVVVQADVQPSVRTRTWNAVGRLAGSEPAGASEALVLSAHLDHVGARPASEDEPGADVIYNGADDDASGVVAVLELARALVAGPRPRRTVVFALFGSEEAGGYGSRYFVDRPVVPLTDIAANLQFEMIGRPDPLVAPGTLWLTGYERSTLGAWLAERGAPLVADPRPDQRFFERSDNIQFARRGVVAHTVSSFGLHQQYHQPSDEMRHINVTHMRDAIASLVEPIRALANATERPAWHPGQAP
jgi:aminopeptidase YwaD